MEQSQKASADDDGFDVLIVGSNQAGLALAYFLRETSLRSLIVDGASTVGESWSSRWDSLTLFTPAQYNSLPGMRFPAPSDTYPTKDDVAVVLAGVRESLLAAHTTRRARHLVGPR